MTLSMYQASVPVFLRALSNLTHVLKKGEAHAKTKDVALDVLLQTRLIPDMLPLVRQVQIATDMTKNGTARLAGVEPLKFEDTETSFEQLHARIERAVDYIKSFKPDQIDGSEGRTVTIKTRNGEQSFEGQAYLLHYVLPNLFFHCTTTYNILRVAGAELGKADYMGKA
ncbi:DUF1993 domain-containing protein [Dyella koreensis]|uniref:DUF1993 domain-containing protein n=1 Tax=Dyella koreensis TaxID=311235 RepID=A0ABW8K6E3_9GAMM